MEMFAQENHFGRQDTGKIRLLTNLSWLKLDNEFMGFMMPVCLPL